MKLNKTLCVFSSLIVAMASSNAATLVVSNVSLGPGDTLYADNANTLMSSGLVTMGYFVSTIAQADIDTIPELVAVLANPSNYTLVTSAIPGLATSTFGNGYANQENGTFVGSISGSNALLGRTLYSIVTDANSLTGVTTANQFALVNIGLIKDDNPDDVLYASNPTGQTIVIGSLGTFDGDAGLGDGEYNTLKMSAVPEPSAALLGALGALGLLRRRRN